MADLPLRLNLGSGLDYRDGYWNVDNAGEVDQLIDLSIYPWELPSDYFRQIVAQDIVEHLLDTVSFMNACWDVAVPDGELIIRTPSYDAEFAHIDPTHVKFFHLDSFDFFDPTTDFGRANIHLTKFKWNIISKVKTENKNLEIVMRKLA